MQLQFVEQPEGFHLCMCNKHDYISDFATLPAAWLTVEGIRFCAREKDNVPYLIQFPYRLHEWNWNHMRKYYCKKCGTVPYKIIKNKDYVETKEREMDVSGI